jgi:hypothetical protein
MGMSTRIVGIKPPDDTWHKMKAVWDSCEKAGIQVPAEVEAYFEEETHSEPDPKGQTVPLNNLAGVRDWTDNDMCQGIEIDLDVVPEGITILRFYNSW